MSEDAKPGGNGRKQQWRHSLARRVLVFIVIAYAIAWLICFSSLKQAQQGWGLLYSDHLNAIDAAAQISTLPDSVFAHGKVPPWPKDKVTPMSSTPADSASPFIWKLISARQQVLDQKQRMMSEIDAQTNYAAQTLSDLKSR